MKNKKGENKKAGSAIWLPCLIVGVLISQVIPFLRAGYSSP